MTHINPLLPADGQQNWAATADNYLTTLTNQINLHDDQITSILANGTGSSTTGTNVVDNLDGTITIPASSTSTTGTAPASASIAIDTDGTPYLVL